MCIRDSAGTEPAAIAHRLTDLTPSLWSDDDADVGDSGVHEGLDAVKEHGLVGHRHELLGGSVGYGAQTGSRPARKNQTFKGLRCV